MASGRSRGVLFLVASLLGAAGVTLMVFNIIKGIQNKPKIQKDDPNVDVVVASKDIAPGWTITAEMLQKRTLPRSYVPEEAIQTSEEIVGRVAMERVLFGEFVREERLAAPEAGVGLPAIIPRGMRAYQVGVKGGRGMAGFLNPGNFVDVIAVCEKADPPEVTTLLTSITVLAVDDRMVDDSYEADAPTDGKKKKKTKIKPSVTLALTPEDTVVVKHATAECSIHLALRNDIDVTNQASNDGVAQPTAAGPAEPLDVEVGVQGAPEATAASDAPAANPADAPPSATPN